MGKPSCYGLIITLWCVLSFKEPKGHLAHWFNCNFTYRIAATLFSTEWGSYMRMLIPYLTRCAVQRTAGIVVELRRLIAMTASILPN